MALHTLSEKWSVEREWDSEWQTIYSGTLYVLDDQTGEILRQVREKYSNIRRPENNYNKESSTARINEADLPSEARQKLAAFRPGLANSLPKSPGG